MAFTLLTHTAKQGTAGAVTTDAISTVGADLIVVVRCMQNEATMTDSASNTWSSAVSIAATSTTRILYCVSPTTSATHTFSQTGSFPALAVACFSGCKLSSPVDQTASHNVNPSTTNATGSITPGEDSELLIFGDTDAWTGSVSVNVGAILDQLALVGGTSFAVSLGYEIQTSATARNVTWTQANTRTNAVVASFKAAAVGINAVFAQTEAADTDVATGTLPINGAFAQTEAADTTATTGTTLAARLCAADITEGNDTLGGTGLHTINVTAAILEGGDAMSTGGVAQNYQGNRRLSLMRGWFADHSPGRAAIVLGRFTIPDTRFYAEMQIVAASGAFENGPVFGIGNAGLALGNPGGTDGFDNATAQAHYAGGAFYNFSISGISFVGWGYPNRITTATQAWSVGDWIGIAVDIAGRHSWVRNATANPTAWFGGPGGGTPDPVTEVQPNDFSAASSSSPVTGSVFLVGGVSQVGNSNAHTASLLLNTGGSIFAATPPTGYVAWGATTTWNSLDKATEIGLSGGDLALTNTSQIVGSNQPYRLARSTTSKG